MKVFLNGNYIQAIDVNHREVRLIPRSRTGTIALQIDIFFGTRREEVSALRESIGDRSYR